MRSYVNHLQAKPGSHTMQYLYMGNNIVFVQFSESELSVDMNVSLHWTLKVVSKLKFVRLSLVMCIHFV